jgi:hypothetical protein
MPPRKGFHHLPSEFIAELGQLQFSDVKARLGRASAAKVKQATGANLPACAHEVILLGAELVLDAPPSAAEPAPKGLRAKRGNQRAILRAILVVSRGGSQGLALTRFAMRCWSWRNITARRWRSFT